MQAEPRPPFSVAFCNALVRVAAQLVPAAQQEEWRQEWFAEIWHRWQFLFYAEGWSRTEALRLIRRCLGAFPDAAWHFASQDAVQNRIRECARSPWACLAGLTASLLLVIALSGGLPATRDLFFSHSPQNSGKLLFIWLHPFTGGGDRGVPPDVVPDWARHSRLLESVAPFNASHSRFSAPGVAPSRPLVITTDPSLFEVLRVKPAIGALPQSTGVVLDYQTWISAFHGDNKVIGSKVQVGRETYPVAGVLPASFRFLSRQPSIYVVHYVVSDPRVMVIGRAKAGTTEDKLNRELKKIAENFSYYFFNSDLRLEFLDTELFTPLRFFGVAVLVSAFMIVMLCRVRLRHVRLAWGAGHRKTAVRRSLFFLAKLALALAFVLVVGLEWSRSESSVLLASRDPASGPFLVWLYILGAMGILFWSLADQRARCRVCLRLLCFPVRIGCPGCLLLDWSGTELLCTEGHGVLHVPHMAPSWDEEAEHWVALDESWSGLFANTK